MKQLLIIKRILFLLMFCWTAGLPALAQREADNWFFGQNASIEFNAAGQPVSFANSSMNAPRGSASISDKTGNLLFYTDGETVWNRIHMVMANGNGLSGNNMARQPAIIIPKPGSSSHYYIFSKQTHLAPQPNQTSNLQYSEVNMQANNGLGEVVASTKNTPILGNTSILYDKITAVHHRNHQDIWVITIRETATNQQEFAAIKITAAGIDPNPVFSQFPKPSALSLFNGDMKASPDGKRLAVAYNHEGWVLNFNDLTGQISNPLVLFTSSIFSQNCGVEFSPDGSKVYFGGGFSIDQFNLSLGSPAAIIASKVSIAANGTKSAALQLATNGKIYVNREGLIGLFEIANPNAPGTASNYRSSLTLASGTLSRYGFPNFIQSYFAPPRFTYTEFCAGKPVSFTIPNTSGIDSVVWNFADTLSAAFNISRQLQPVHVFSLPGTYYVTLNVFSQGIQSVFEQPVIIKSTPRVRLPNDTTICAGQELILRNKFPLSPFNERFKWSTGDTTAAILVQAPGVYWIELNNGTCTARDSITITVLPQPTVSLGGTKVFCGSQPYTLNAYVPLAGATYLWTPGGQTTPTITVNKTGLYGVTVNVNGCIATDQAQINFTTLDGFELGPDITVCEGESVVLRTISPAANTFYEWSDGTRNTNVLRPKKSGQYWVQVIRNGCLVTDTINVTFKECPPPPVPVIPNIITPNNDQRNDYFVLKEIPEGAWNLKLFNRWGIEIYSKKGYRNDWPQTTVPTGTYYYFLEDPDTGRTWKGWLEVMY